MRDYHLLITKTKTVQLLQSHSKDDKKHHFYLIYQH